MEFSLCEAGQGCPCAGLGWVTAEAEVVITLCTWLFLSSLIQPCNSTCKALPQDALSRKTRLLLHPSHQPHPLTGSKVFSSCSLLTVILKAIVNLLLKSFLIAKMKTNSNFKTKLVTNAGRILEVSIWQNSQLHPQTVN